MGKYFLLILISLASSQLFSDDKSALKEIRGEKKVLKAEIKENTLYATVKDDGTNRKGYAEYLCQTLKEHSLNSVTVKVIDNKNKVLGESNCKF